MGIAKEISPYAVKAIWNEEEIGSGLLAKSKNNTYYVFTVRHLFKKGTDTDYRDVEETFISTELNNIYFRKRVLKDDKKFKVNGFIFFDNSDLLIFTLEKNEVNDLQKTKVLKNNHQEEIYYFYGYPKGGIDFDNETTGTIVNAQYSQSNEEENNIFRLQSTINIDGEAVSGYSGSGVFRKKDGNIYLVGIFSRAKSGLSYYECVDFVTMINEINLKLREKFDDEIEVVGFELEKQEKKYEDKIKVVKNRLIGIMVILGVIYFTTQTSQNISNENFTLTMKTYLREKPLLGINFFDDNKCKVELDGNPISPDGKYKLSLPITKGINKIIYIKNESIQCRDIKLNPSKTNYTFLCYINIYKDSPNECISKD